MREDTGADFPKIAQPGLREVEYGNEDQEAPDVGYP
jgi:hypothetical protein